MGDLDVALKRGSNGLTRQCCVPSRFEDFGVDSPGLYNTHSQEIIYDLALLPHLVGKLGTERKRAYNT
jgi:hypothetical protein